MVVYGLGSLVYIALAAWMDLPRDSAILGLILLTGLRLLSAIYDIRGD